MDGILNVPFETQVYWCNECKIPLLEDTNKFEYECPLCHSKLTYLSADLRPVFPQERLLLEAILKKPLAYKNDSVWFCNSRYYINGEVTKIGTKDYESINVDEVIKTLKEYESQNTDEAFNKYVKLFCDANSEREILRKEEAKKFIIDSAEQFYYPKKNIPAKDKNLIISFSGGKDSTVTADLVIKAIGTTELVHIFGDTTLEFPTTISYAERYRKAHPRAIFKIAKNSEQDFMKVCDDIGPPARMMRWCCSMFKTGPISRTLNNLCNDEKVLTYYGIRKVESVARSKYDRLTDDVTANAKIKKQVDAAPIFYWTDLDIWLYILTEEIDFNESYKLGYDRVGCWCCPNNNVRAQFLSKIYMPERSKEWRDFLIKFAKRVGKPDAEVYVDSGKWKARQGGNGVKASEDIKIKFSNCTTEDNAKIYQLNKKPTKQFYMMFTPFGNVNFELGRKLVGEILVLDPGTNVPILSIQPFTKDDYEFSVKIKTMNVANHEELHIKTAYQVRKYNACRKCLKCESICKHGAISIHGDEYIIDAEKCVHCRMCVTQKFLDGGCIMSNYLATSSKYEKENL